MLQLSKFLYRSYQIEVNLFLEEFHQIFTVMSTICSLHGILRDAFNYMQLSTVVS